MFLKNDRGLAIKNGSVATLEMVDAGCMMSRWRPHKSKGYAHLDHGYAAAIHKGTGCTVDRVHVLATPGLDRHAAYAALSRHGQRVLHIAVAADEARGSDHQAFAKRAT
jgi:ATP-dependent exoDNAse (exonuclease V) alpha subunit